MVPSESKRGGWLMPVTGMIRKRTLVALAAASTVLLVGLEGAAADTGHYTKGDAEAVLAAYPTGGGAIDTHAGHVHVGPALAGPQDGLSIRPISPFFSRARYCVLDWHAVALALIDFEFVVHTDPPFVYTRDDALSYLNSVEIEFFLDGSPFAASEMPIKPYLVRSLLDFFEAQLEAEFKAEVTIGDAWAMQAGRAVSPSELPVGKHRLSAIVSDALGTFKDGVPFYVDPATSETCTG